MARVCSILAGDAGMNEDKMQKFEAWAIGIGHDPREMVRHSDGGYERPSVHWQWQAWQAATRAAVPAWQPIETAPKDGTNVLLLNRAGNMACGMWMESRGLGTGWFLRGGSGPDLFFNYHHGPTHWMPLPEAP